MILFPKKYKYKDYIREVETKKCEHINKNIHEHDDNKNIHEVSENV